MLLNYHIHIISHLKLVSYILTKTHSKMKQTEQFQVFETLCFARLYPTSSFRQIFFNILFQKPKEKKMTTHYKSTV